MELTKVVEARVTAQPREEHYQLTSDDLHAAMRLFLATKGVRVGEADHLHLINEATDVDRKDEKWSGLHWNLIVQRRGETK